MTKANVPVIPMKGTPANTRGLTIPMSRSNIHHYGRPIAWMLCGFVLRSMIQSGLWEWVGNGNDWNTMVRMRQYRCEEHEQSSPSSSFPDTAAAVHARTEPPSEAVAAAAMPSRSAQQTILQIPGNDHQQRQEHEAHSNICRDLAGKSALHLWTTHIPRIIQATRMRPDDPVFDAERRVTELMQLITPRLPWEARTLPQHPQQVHRMHTIMSQLLARYRYLQQRKRGKESVSADHDSSTSGHHEVEYPDPQHQPPVKIVVFGGSVTCGAGCSGAVQVHPDKSRLCAWPRRFQMIVDNWFEEVKSFGDVLQVYNACRGATDSSVSQYLLELELLPSKWRHPDIIINSHSTNDVSTFFENGGDQQRPHDFLYRDRLQGFVRSVMQRQHVCVEPPLLLFVDDHLGNSPRELIGSLVVQQNLDLLSSYYGFGLLSYANAVRDWVLADTHETWFSPFRWYSNAKPAKTQPAAAPKDEAMRTERHPGEMMHQSVALMLSYYFLHAATEICALERWPSISTMVTKFMPGILGFPDSLDHVRGPGTIYHRPSQRPLYALPPKIDVHLSLEQISRLWHEEEAMTRQRLFGEIPLNNNYTRNATMINAAGVKPELLSSSALSYCASPGGRADLVQWLSLTRCPFSFIADYGSSNLTADQDYVLRHVEIPAGSDRGESILNSTTQPQVSWHYASDRDKHGWVPHSRDPWVLDFDFTNQIPANPAGDITTARFLYMKSYGELWANSRVNVTVWDRTEQRQQQQPLDQNSGAINASQLAQHTLEGFHDTGSSTSVLYVDRVVLAKPTRNLRIHLSLVGGQTFKLIGMSLCSVHGP